MFSVIISAYDQHELTVIHIRECMNSTLVPDEIVAVNDGGTDDLREMLRGLPKKCPVIYARIKEDLKWNQQGARNLGLYLSRGDMVFVEDNDHIPDRDYYSLAVDKLNNGFDAALCKNRLFVFWEDIKNKKLEDWSRAKNRTFARWIGGYQREVLLKMKGFDEGFVGHYGWEVPDFLRKREKLGTKSANIGTYFMVQDAFSNKGNRPMAGDRFKMEAENSYLLQRNSKKGLIQSEKGILNFNFDYERMV